MKGASPKDDDGGLIWRAVTFSKMHLFYSQKVRGRRRRRHVDVRKAQNEKTGKV
jgi:hypothetical protein